MAKIDAALIYPNNRNQAYGPLAPNIAAITAPVQVGLLAAFLRREGFSVKIIDAEAFFLSSRETADQTIACDPRVAVVACDQLNSADVTKVSAALDFAHELKSRAGHIKTVLEGVVPTAYPEKMLREEHVDFVCQGEAFDAVKDLLRVMKSGKAIPDAGIEGLWFMRGQEVVSSRRRPLIQDPDSLPDVAWDLLPVDRYRAHHWHCFDDLDRRQPYASIYTNMGCPYDCNFCNVNVVFGKPNFRTRSPERVVAEIDLLVKAHKIRNIRIIDNVFTVSHDFVDKFCDLLIKRGHDLNIWCYARAETAQDGPLLKKMRKAGITWIAYGIEAASERVRKAASKGTRQAVIDRAVELTREAGINIIGNIIFGLIEDDHETMRQSLDMAKEYNFEWANFHAAMAYPGTELNGIAIKEGIKLPEGWKGYGQYSQDALPMSTKYLTPAEVLAFRDRAFHEYFTNPNYLDMIEKKFGPKPLPYIRDILKFPIHRKLLEGKTLGLPRQGRFAYDPAAFDFADLVKECLVRGKFVPDKKFELKDLHKILAPEVQRYLDTKDFTRLTTYFFDLFDSGHELSKLYVRFLREVIKPKLGADELVYQITPVFRFTFPAQKSMIPGKDQHGTFHADYMNAHPPLEINFWLPLTPCQDSNSLQMLGVEDSRTLLRDFEEDWLREHKKPFVESLYDDAKHLTVYGLLGQRALPLAKPLAGGMGDVFHFTPHDVHGTLYNRTDSTRVSMDFRVLRKSDYDALGREYKTLSGERAYKVGDLYGEC